MKLKQETNQPSSKYFVSNFINMIQNRGHAQIINPSKELSERSFNETYSFLVNQNGKLNINRSINFYPLKKPYYDGIEVHKDTELDSTRTTENFIGDYTNPAFLELVAEIICNSVFDTKAMLTIAPNSIDWSHDKEYMKKSYLVAQGIYLIANQMLKLDFSKLFEIIKNPGNQVLFKKTLIDEFQSKPFNPIKYTPHDFGRIMDYDMNLFIACLNDAKNLYGNFKNGIITEEEMYEEIEELSQKDTPKGTSRKRVQKKIRIQCDINETRS